MRFVVETEYFVTDTNTIDVPDTIVEVCKLTLQ
jgi:hypothetical protein